MKNLDYFYSVCKVLNEMDIVPILYGSVGLEFILQTNLNSDDIDLLISKEYLTDKWTDFMKIMKEKLNLDMVDEHEHTFLNNEMKVAFANYEELDEYIGFGYKNVTTFFNEDIKFKVLNAKQYLKIYNKSKEDGYRANKKNNADLKKIEIISSYLDKKKKEIEALKLVKLEPSDFESVISLYKTVIASTLTTWDDEYPSKELIFSDLNNECLYGYKDGNNLIGVVFISSEFESSSPFTFKLKSPFRFARICIHPLYQGMGLGTKLVSDTIEIIKKAGGDGIQISVYEDNCAAISTYKKFGFVQTGTDFKYGYNYILFEVKLA